MIDLKQQAKSRVKSARTASTASKTSSSSSSGGSKLKAAAKARPKPQSREFKVMGEQEEWLEEQKLRRDPEYMPPLPPETTPPIPPGPQALEHQVSPTDPFLSSFARIPGLRKRSGVQT